ncbi:MAG: GNAT family N-acetyltransferase [Acidobacteriaceae bacterium]
MSVVIREFQPGDEAVFRALNEAWIIANFQLEEKDCDILQHPQKYILEPGGRIYFAVESANGKIIGCCALLPIGPGALEVAKMAVAENQRGQGVGRQLLREVIVRARELGATRLYLETNHTLTNAIALYRSEGFRLLRPQDLPPSPYARVDVFMERDLDSAPSK